MASVRVRFVGGPADELTRDLPAGPDGGPPPRWVLRHPEEPAEGVADHLYERDEHAAAGGWTMRYVHTFPFGATE
ncbi:MULTISPECIES: hypothetical protein [Micromonospora]|uniref:Uncharacterized protein n=1 Tax=Micromonospora chalcea TaxID=1874 RepID=A0ABX9Y0A9_MICCH|nr:MULTISPECIES: hypothetical protein [Micromonospora]MBP1783103.1 hypothetical protein [Micromonospora sp. HB375]MBQ1064912.1 hypothetical protein [Micromonospora sp. C41]MCK1809587.1 hypothetical protein [Micromonospora sp. R42106]MCK1834558.1 hypothetical protein [Micromonospora sp. R42003]MCK1846488.1 hypothetical protein [Micromonospora sp. R42004]